MSAVPLPITHSPTLQSLLISRAELDKTWLILPADPLTSDEARRLSFREVRDRALACAAGLRARGATPGRAVGLLYDTDEHFCVAFFGTLLAGLVPVPLHPPSMFGNIGEQFGRLLSTLTASEAQFVFVPGALRASAAALSDSGAAPLTLEELVVSRSIARDRVLEFGSGDDVALVQYSSGTTGSPRGIELTHANVLANVHGIGLAVDVDPNETALCWLPLSHDMGLSGLLLYSLYWGMSLVLLSPRTFAFGPASWLWAMSRFRAAGCAAPNFAYAICASARKVPDEVLAGLDLSSWRVALNGAEAVLPETIEQFTARFARYGFLAEAMLPVYGLAENVVAVSFSPLGRLPRIDWVDRAQLETDGAASPGDRGSGTRGIASVGTPLNAQRVRIVDTSSRAPLPERRVGDIEVFGPSVMKGYWKRPGAARESIREDGWLRSGDLGYLAGGELYVVGRSKNVIKKHGKSIDAEDIQGVVGLVPGVRTGCVGVFGRENPGVGTDDLVILAETRLDDTGALDDLRSRISRDIVRVFGVAADVVRLLPPGSLPKTTSGKVRHIECRPRFERGEFEGL